MTLKEHVSCRALALDSQMGRSNHVTPAEHVLSWAVALRLPQRQVLYVILRSTCGLGRWGGPLRDSYEHFWFRA